MKLLEDFETLNLLAARKGKIKLANNWLQSYRMRNASKDNAIICFLLLLGALATFAAMPRTELASGFCDFALGAFSVIFALSVFSHLADHGKHTRRMEAIEKELLWGETK